MEIFVDLKLVQKTGRIGEVAAPYCLSTELLISLASYPRLLQKIKAY